MISPDPQGFGLFPLKSKAYLPGKPFEIKDLRDPGGRSSYAAPILPCVPGAVNRFFVTECTIFCYKLLQKTS
jgi:hypothetical protein